MFLIIDLQNDTKGYINLGNDLSHAQDLLNMVENNLVFIKDGYNEFEKLTPKCSVEVVKEITLKKESYSDKIDNLVIGGELDKESIGTLAEPIECERNLKAIQELYLSKISTLKKELSTKNATIQHLENQVADLEDRLTGTEAYIRIGCF